MELKYSLEQIVHIELDGRFYKGSIVGIHIWRDKTICYEIYLPLLDIKITLFQDEIFENEYKWLKSL